MQTQKTLMDYVGKNEKTTIIAKLSKKGQGAPSREPVFSEEEKKKMMACAYKKQEELKVECVVCRSSHLLLMGSVLLFFLFRNWKQIVKIHI